MANIYKFVRSAIAEYLCCFVFYAINFAIIINVQVAHMEIITNYMQSLGATGVVVAPVVVQMLYVITLGISVVVSILVFGPTSGAHVNPLYTFSVTLLGQFPPLKGILF